MIIYTDGSKFMHITINSLIHNVTEHMSVVCGTQQRAATFSVVRCSNAKTSLYSYWLSAVNLVIVQIRLGIMYLFPTVDRTMKHSKVVVTDPSFVRPCFSSAELHPFSNV